MLKVVIYLIICVVSLNAQASAVDKESITVFTEDFPPYNYLYQNILVGDNVEIVDRVFKELQLTPNYVVMPWARSYQMALATPNSLVFSMARNKEREHKFKWVGSLNGVETCLFSLRNTDHADVRTLEEAKKFKVVTQLGGHISVLLTREGFKQGQNLFGSVNVASALKMLETGRTDLIGLPERVMYYYLQLQNRKPTDVIEKQFCFDSSALYLAFNIETPDVVVEKFKEALVKVKLDMFGPEKTYVNSPNNGTK